MNGEPSSTSVDNGIVIRGRYFREFVGLSAEIEEDNKEEDVNESTSGPSDVVMQLNY